jgi:hypothetical protein
MDALFEARGYKRVNLDRVTSLDAPPHRGIDGVYFSEGPPPSYVVAEAKFGTGYLKKLKNGVLQMSDEWIEDRLAAAVGKDMVDEILDTGFDRVLVRVDSNGNATQSLLNATGQVIR